MKLENFYEEYGKYEELVNSVQNIYDNAKFDTFKIEIESPIYCIYLDKVCDDQNIEDQNKMYDVERTSIYLSKLGKEIARTTEVYGASYNLVKNYLINKETDKQR